MILRDSIHMSSIATFDGSTGHNQLRDKEVQYNCTDEHCQLMGWAMGHCPLPCQFLTLDHSSFWENISHSCNTEAVSITHKLM